jgi:4-amino-4-deoxy-L-arabinose transferase-like glycosyltransferase
MRVRGIGNQDGSPGKWMPLLTSLVGGIFLRFWYLGSKSLWLDEAHAAAMARLSFSDFWAGVDPYHPPLHFMLLGALLPPGRSEFWLRFPSAIAGCLAIPFAYLLGRHLFDREVGSTTALLTAFSPLLIWYSQEGRSYSLVTLLLLVAILGAIGLTQQFRLSLWLLFVVAGVIAFYLHYGALVLMPLSGLFVLIMAATKHQGWHAVGWWLAAWVVIGFACIPWMLSPSFAGFIGVMVSPDNYVYRIFGLSGTIGRLSPAYMLGIFLGLAASLGMAAAIFSRILLRCLRRRIDWTRLRQSRWMQGGATGLFLLVLVATVVTRGYTVKKFLSPLWPYLLLVFAWFWPWTWRLRMRASAMAGLCALGAVGIALWVPKAGWREASDYILAHSNSRSLVVLEPAYMTVPFDYYNAHRTKRAGVAFGVQPAELQKLMEGSDDIWFGFDPRESDPQGRNLNWLISRAKTVELVSFYRLRLYRIRLPSSAYLPAITPQSTGTMPPESSVWSPNREPTACTAVLSNSCATTH